MIKELLSAFEKHPVVFSVVALTGLILANDFMTNFDYEYQHGHKSQAKASKLDKVVPW